MTADASNGVGRGVAPGHSEPEVRASDAQREEWAMLLARRVESELRDVVIPAAEAGAEGEGHSAGRMTPVRGSLDGVVSVASGTETGAQEPAPLNRVWGELELQGMGRIRFAVARENGNISVVLGVENLQQRALVELEKGTLLQRLEQSGLKVASVTVTSPEAAGTALAQPRKAIQRHGADGLINAYQRRSKQDEEQESELSLIG